MKDWKKDVRRALIARDEASLESALQQLTPAQAGKLEALACSFDDDPYLSFRVLEMAIRAPKAGLTAVNNAVYYLNWVVGEPRLDPQRVEAVIAKAEESAPGNPSIFHNLACVYVKQGDLDQAMACVEGAARHHYDHLSLLCEDDDLEPLHADPRFGTVLDGADWAFPAPLARFSQLSFDYDDGDGIDYEPFTQFMPAEENDSWLQAWTGNPELTADAIRVFGQDGTGGYAAFWLINDQADLLDQPVVFFGSEGERGAVARNFADFLWLMASGYGPREAVEYPPLNDEPRRIQPDMVTLAEQYAPNGHPSPLAVLTAAADVSARFCAWLESVVR